MVSSTVLLFIGILVNATPPHVTAFQPYHLFQKSHRFTLLFEQRHSHNQGLGDLAQDTPWSEDPLVEAQFGGVSRLYGAQNLSRLMASRVCVVGIGGVGGWTAEALVRSGVGSISLVDMDEVCISNANRQVHALPGTVGLPKSEALACRLSLINQHCEIHQIRDFLSKENAHEILSGEASGIGGMGYDVVVDAIDGAREKCDLLLACRAIGVPLVVVGGAGGKTDPTKVRCADITRATNCRIISQMRKRLRQKFGFPSNGKGYHKEEFWSIPCIYGEQPSLAAVKDSDGLVGCDAAFGTSCAVTGTFGFAAAAAAIDTILSRDGSS